MGSHAEAQTVFYTGDIYFPKQTSENCVQIYIILLYNCNIQCICTIYKISINAKLLSLVNGAITKFNDPQNPLVI